MLTCIHVIITVISRDCSQVCENLNQQLRISRLKSYNSILRGSFSSSAYLAQAEWDAVHRSSMWKEWLLRDPNFSRGFSSLLSNAAMEHMSLHPDCKQWVTIVKINIVKIQYCAIAKLRNCNIAQLRYCTIAILRITLKIDTLFFHTVLYNWLVIAP